MSNNAKTASATETVAEKFKDAPSGAKILWPADIPDDILDDIISFSKATMEKLNPEKDGTKIADAIKHHMDEKWGKHWHVVIGRNFGSHVIHERQRFTYFYLGQYALMVYKAGSG